MVVGGAVVVGKTRRKPHPEPVAAPEATKSAHSHAVSSSLSPAPSASTDRRAYPATATLSLQDALSRQTIDLTKAVCDLHGIAHSSGGSGRRMPQGDEVAVAKALGLLKQPPALTLPTRGLVNSSNFCFMNSVMQSLLSIPPVVQLCISLQGCHVSNTAPTWVSIGKWIIDTYARGSTSSIAGAGCVAPPRFPIMNGHRMTQFQGHTQQDAHEFVLFLLDHLRDELCAMEAAVLEEEAARAEDVQGETIDESRQQVRISSKKDKGWITVGHGGEKLKLSSSGVDSASAQERDLLWKSLFGGELHSFVKGGKSTARNVTSVTREPFLCLSLPVDCGTSSPPSISALLEASYGNKEVIEDASRGRDLSRRQLLGKLPLVLILQLKRWAVTAEGDNVKLDNVVKVDQELIIPVSCVFNRETPVKQRSFRLHAAVCHRGAGDTAGHYVSYVIPPQHTVQHRDPHGDSPNGSSSSAHEVILCNDTKISRASFQSLINDLPYILFYVKS